MSLPSSSRYPHGLPNTTGEMEWKRKMARSYAISRMWNVRNTKHEWYEYWNQMALELTAGDLNLLVFPQFPAWYGDGDLPHPPDSPRVPPLPRARIEGMSILEHADSDDAVSVSTTQTTSLPQKSSACRYPDFAILRIGGVANSRPPNDRRAVYEGIEVPPGAIEIKMLIEVKHGSSRQLLNMEDNALRDAVLSIIGIAQRDIYRQSAIIFARFPGLTSLRCLVASGDYWQTSVINRNNILRNHYAFVGLEDNYPGDAQYTVAVWNPPYPVKVSASFSWLRIIFRELRQ